MIKPKSVLEIKIDERLYQLLCDNDAPLGAVHDALCQMRAFVVQRIVDLDKDKQKEEPKPEGS
jgi:hypothetical protein